MNQQPQNHRFSPPLATKVIYLVVCWRILEAACKANSVNSVDLGPYCLSVS